MKGAFIDLKWMNAPFIHKGKRQNQATTLN